MGRVYEHVASLLEEASRGTDIAVEIGCGSKQYRPWVAGRYVGIDMEEYYPGGRADVKADAHLLPIRSNSVGMVFMVATLFLIPREGEVLAEIWRVLRPGGKLLIFDYSWWRARNHRENQYSSLSLRRRLGSMGFGPRIHWSCSRLWGGNYLAWLSSSPIGRLITYLIGNWIIVSGVKPREGEEWDRL